MPNFEKNNPGTRLPYTFEPSSTATGSSIPSPDLPDWKASGTAGRSFQPNNSDRQFIKLLQSFKEKIQQGGLPQGQSEFFWLEKMKISASELLDVIHPDKISLNLTHENSIFYTLLKNDIVIFFEHFLVEEHDDNDEAGFTAFRGDQKLANYGGSLHESLYELTAKLKGEIVKPLMVA
jgi:hypothetical protein